MKDYTAKDIRNIGIFGHGGEGKTSLTEAMLFNAGLVDRIGSVQNGTTTTDFDPEETKRHISPSTSLSHRLSGKIQKSTLSMLPDSLIFMVK